jgi:hypothetical protein
MYRIPIYKTGELILKLRHMFQSIHDNTIMNNVRSNISVASVFLLSREQQSQVVHPQRQQS